MNKVSETIKLINCYFQDQCHLVEQQNEKLKNNVNDMMLEVNRLNTEIVELQKEMQVSVLFSFK